MLLSPDQLDAILDKSETRVLYKPNTGQVDLDPRLALLYQLNEVLQMAGGNAGTHAYDMMAAVEEINTGNMAVLIELIAAVVLSGCISDDATTIETSFTPQDIDDMQKRFEMSASRNGLLLTVRLDRKPEEGVSWRLDETEDPVGARDQATGHPERPRWTVRDSEGVFHPYPTKGHAQLALVNDFRGDEIARVENRYCLHYDCPSTHCNDEATSVKS